MKKAILIHNSTAGDGNHGKKELKSLVEKGGYKVKYYGTNSLFWKSFNKEDADVIFVAGGDGTIQKVAKAMLEAKGDKILQVPIKVLPYGTANNIATSLKIRDPQFQIEDESKLVKFDVGLVEGVLQENFFVEGVGCGIFPKLVQVMQAKPEDAEDSTEGELKQSLEELLRIIETYEARDAIIIADNEEITGKFLLIELMNIKLIGPNIELAPDAKTGDGQYELVTIKEDAREDLKVFIKHLLNENSSRKAIEEFADLRKVQQVRIKWEGQDVHVDDEVIEDYKGQEIKIKNRQGIFKFFTSENI